MKYIDSHAHYTSLKFNADRDTVIKNCLKNNAEAIIECGTNTAYIKKALNLAHQYDNIYAVIGYFPTDTPELETPGVFENYVKKLDDKKVIGIGEIGLDYYHHSDVEIQKKWFKEQLSLAKSLGLPVCIHSRDAEEDALNILLDHGRNQGVIHSFSYGIDAMYKLLNLGYYFGVGGMFTYKKNQALREAVKEMPIERILLETDCPYLTPESHRRERNDSSYIMDVIREISVIKNISEEEIIAKTNKNVHDLYKKMNEYDKAKND